jgi:hypothetical protein
VRTDRQCETRERIFCAARICARGKLARRRPVTLVDRHALLPQRNRRDREDNGERPDG